MENSQPGRNEYIGGSHEKGSDVELMGIAWQSDGLHLLEKPLEKWAGLPAGGKPEFL